MSFSCYQENQFYAKLLWDQACAIYLIGKQQLPFISHYSTHFHSHLCTKKRGMVSLRIVLNWVSFCETMQLLINNSVCRHLNHCCFHDKEYLGFLLNQMNFYGLQVPFYPWDTLCPTQKNAKLNESKIISISSFIPPSEMQTCTCSTHTHTHSYRMVFFGHLKGCKWLGLFKMATEGPSKFLYSAGDLNCVLTLALAVRLFCSALVQVVFRTLNFIHQFSPKLAFK